MRSIFPRPATFLFLLPLLAACHTTRRVTETTKPPERSAVISFARKQLGQPYQYGGATPRGFDCSGFVSYVFAHFSMVLPRTSAAQASYGRAVPLKQARPGDLIFFTGRDAGSGQVGHVGIITRAAGPDTEFIHAASTGVVLTLLSAEYYRKRFVRIAAVLR